MPTIEVTDESNDIVPCTITIRAKALKRLDEIRDHKRFNGRGATIEHLLELYLMEDDSY